MREHLLMAIHAFAGWWSCVCFLVDGHARVRWL